MNLWLLYNISVEGLCAAYVNINTWMLVAAFRNALLLAFLSIVEILHALQIVPFFVHRVYKEMDEVIYYK